MVAVVVSRQLKASAPSLSSSSCRNPMSANNRNVHTVARDTFICSCANC